MHRYILYLKEIGGAISTYIIMTWTLILIFEFTSKIACDIYKLFSAYYNKLPITVYINQRLTEHTTILTRKLRREPKWRFY